MSGWLLGAALLALGGIAAAHHSTANFDRTKEETIKGKVIYFGFTNPHSYIDIEVVNPATGKTEPYKVFAAGRVLLVRYDWKPTRREVRRHRHRRRLPGSQGSAFHVPEAHRVRERQGLGAEPDSRLISLAPWHAAR